MQELYPTTRYRIAKTLFFAGSWIIAATFSFINRSDNPSIVSRILTVLSFFCAIAYSGLKNIETRRQIQKQITRHEEWIEDIDKINREIDVLNVSVPPLTMPIGLFLFNEKSHSLVLCVTFFVVLFLNGSAHPNISIGSGVAILLF